MLHDVSGQGTLGKCEDIRTPVQVHNDLEAGIPGPLDGVVQIFQLTVHVGLAVEGRHGPVPHGDSNVVQTRLGHLVEVVGPDEVCPVVGETVPGLIFAQRLGQGPFVDGGLWASVEDRGGDPRLEHQPTTQVDTADLVGIEVKGSRTRLQVSTLGSAVYSRQRLDLGEELTCLRPRSQPAPAPAQ